MRFLLKLERKFGKYAIRNLPLYIMIAYGFGYIMSYIKPGSWLYMLSLNPHAILHGQVWRLFTWVLVPEDNMNIFFLLIGMYFYYVIGRSVERAWGSFLFNVYFFLGCILTVTGAFLLHFYLYFFGQDFLEMVRMVYGGTGPEAACPMIYGGDWGYAFVSMMFGTYYLNLSIFLLYAITYPEARVLLFFLIPIKVKILGIIYVIVLGFSVFTSFFTNYQYGIINMTVVFMSLLNTLLFFLMTRRKTVRSPKQVKRQREYNVKMKQAARAVAHHKCTVCGQTDESNPDLTFRFCSKCVGTHEYCSEHLFTHTHIKG